MILRSPSSPPAPGFRPVRVIDVELSQPVRDLAPVSARDGSAYGAALALGLLHGAPLGLVEVSLTDGACSGRALERAVRDGLAGAIAEHLATDAALTDVPGVGGAPACELRRRKLLGNAPSLTVIIPTRDRPERLERCVRSILSGSYPTDRREIVIVDNAPSDNATSELAVRLVEEGHAVRYAREERPGSASARNAGLRVATGELIAFTDDDVLVDHHWLAELAVGFAAMDIGCVTGLVVPLELETPAQVWFEQYGGFSVGKCSERTFDVRHPYEGAGPLFPYAAGIYGTGNNMAFRRQTLTEIGDFDPALGNGTPALGGVDSEVLLRTVLRGHRLLYHPAAFVRHRHRPDYAGLHRQIYCYGVGLTAYLTKTMMSDPRVIPHIARRIPGGLRHALGGSSTLNEHKRADFPKALTRAEIRGMLYGPLAYVRSRRQFGAHRPPRRPH